MSTQKVCHGSCHCGDVQYQIKLTFPPIMEIQAQSTRLYKCNCTTCHKTGFFHCRPISAADDFILTSPPNIEELGDYRVYDKKVGFYFCTKCGVRTFAAGGAWEQVEVDVDEWAGNKKEGDEGRPQKVWKINETEVVIDVGDGQKVPKKVHYLSVNAVTLDGGEQGVDLREWHEKGWMFYVENLHRKDRTTMPPMSLKPFECGMY